MTMSIIWGAIEAIFVFAALLTAYHFLDDVDDDLDKEAHVGFGTDEFVTAGGIAVMVGVINAFAPLLQERSLFLAPFMLMAMIAVYVYLAVLWHEKGSELKEMIPFIFILVPITFTTRQVAWSLTALIQNDFLASVVQTLPTCLSVLTLGSMVFDFFHLRYAETELFDADDTKGERRLKVKGKIGMIATTAFVAMLLIGACVDGLEFGKTNDAEVQLTDGVYAASGDDIGSVTLDTHDGVHFYHFDVLNDGKDSNDWNNGPAVKGDYESTLKKRIKKDPALLAQLMMAYDYTVNTDFIGETIYVDYNDKWTVLDRTDAACRIMASNASIHKAGYKAISRMIDGADKVTHEKRRVYDMVFMHSNTIDGIPSTVVFDSNVKEAWCTVLYYSFKDSDATAEIVLREACGFQWANGASLIGVTPASYPVGGVGGGANKPSGKGDKSHASKPSKKPSGGNPPSGPSYNKDPNKAPTKDTEPNDDKGPGPDTNNPKDPNHSTEDKPSNSDHMTYDEYKDRVKQNEDANKPSGGSSSGDSSSGGSSSGGTTHRDDNSSSGNGNGGIDKPTPSSKPASSGGKPVTDSGAGDKWDGPSD